MDRARRRRLAEELAAKVVRARKDVRAVVLFGSVARGDDLPDSDVELIAVAAKGPWEPTRFVLGGVLFSVYWKRWPSLMQSMLEPDGDAQRRGFLGGVALYDPEGLFRKLHALVAALPRAFYPKSAEEALHGAYEYLCKTRNAWRRRDRANLEYGARVTAYNLASVVALVNRRHFTSENTVPTEWRDFPDLPRGFDRIAAVVKGGGSDRRLYEDTMALWRATRDWAARRRVRLHTVRSLRQVRIPKTT